MKSFIDYPQDHEFPLENLPLGVCKVINFQPFACTRIGDYIVNLKQLEHNEILILNNLKKYFAKPTLGVLMEEGPANRRLLREKLLELFDISQASQAHHLKKYLHHIKEARMHLPAQSRDITHFSTSVVSQGNIGSLLGMFGQFPLADCFFNIPLGHNGRSSAITSKSFINQPLGYYRNPDNCFGPSEFLDYSLGVGFYIGGKNPKYISYDDAEDRIFGYVLVNDWTAHDLKVFEQVPCGPLNSKNFATTISPWVITPEALEPFKFRMEKPILPPSVHLVMNERTLYDIDLSMHVHPYRSKAPILTSSTNMKEMYWSPKQLVIHQMASRTKLNPCDLICSGTLSSFKENGEGSLFERSMNGSYYWRNKLDSRKYLIQGDSILMNGVAQNKDFKIGFGETRIVVQNSLVKLKHLSDNPSQSS